MNSVIYRFAEFAASHGHAELFVRAFHVLTRHRFALQPIRVRVRRER